MSWQSSMQNGTQHKMHPVKKKRIAAEMNVSPPGDRVTRV